MEGGRQACFGPYASRQACLGPYAFFLIDRNYAELSKDLVTLSWLCISYGSIFLNGSTHTPNELVDTELTLSKSKTFRMKTGTLEPWYSVNNTGLLQSVSQF